MSEVSKGQIQTALLDHLGLVAAICQDLKIAQKSQAIALRFSKKGIYCSLLKKKLGLGDNQPQKKNIQNTTR